MKVTKYTQEGKASGEVELNDKIFGSAANKGLIFDVVQSQMASKRQGTASTKARSEVRGGGKKPYKQKGTGNARQGSIRAPHYVGGGVSFGPKPRDYSYELPKKQRKKALIGVLSQKATDGEISVFTEFTASKPQTKEGIKFLGEKANTSTLIVDVANEVLSKSVRNIKNTKYLEAEGLNVYDILRYKNVFISQAGLKKIEERLGE